VRERISLLVRLPDGIQPPQEKETNAMNKNEMQEWPLVRGYEPESFEGEDGAGLPSVLSAEFDADGHRWTCLTEASGERVWPTRAGRWGVRQINRHGENTGGGTVNLGWATREEAEAANPPRYGYTFEPFERWGEAAVCVDAGVGCGGPLYFFGARWVCRAHSIQRGIY
jgi:hypothetical protein